MNFISLQTDPSISFGHHTTDVEFRYNGRGERTHMITYYGPENTSATTRWAYNARGQLAFKQDARGKRVHYAYTPGGKLKTRTWARGVITTYHYDADNHIDLRQIDYSDDTPDVAFTYDRLGRRHTVTDAGGVVTHTYDGEHLTSETRHGDFQVPNQFLYGEPKTLTHTRDDFDRPSGFQIGTATDPSRDYEVKYGYDLAGRLATVHAQGYGFEYGYEPNSTTDRVKTVTAPFVKQTEFTYEPGRDAIASVANRVGFNVDQALSEFAYTNNADGRRTEKIATYVLPEPSSLSERYAYDPDTGGVTSVEIDSPNADVAAPGSYAYVYDKIGNRQSASVDDDEHMVSEANALNQYVTINGRSLAYDADGNLTAKGERSYRWDAENRLIEIHEHDTLIARYAYDHQSRRIARWTRDGVDERYLYDGWNLIAVYHVGETEPAETYTWGNDLSGSLQGAGGVGGLLFAKKREHGNDAWIYHYDANGNVIEVTNSRGDLSDRYVYDAFGNLIGDPRVPENRYRFSTKPQDRESGFYYYGYRYYGGAGGRWLSRDPIEELGGVNMYGVLGNDLINHIDNKGLDLVLGGKAPQFGQDGLWTGVIATAGEILLELRLVDMSAEATSLDIDTSTNGTIYDTTNGTGSSAQTTTFKGLQVSIDRTTVENGSVLHPDTGEICEGLYRAELKYKKTVSGPTYEAHIMLNVAREEDIATSMPKTSYEVLPDSGDGTSTFSEKPKLHFTPPHQNLWELGGSGRSPRA